MGKTKLITGDLIGKQNYEDLIIRDTDDITKYPIERVKNRVIWGDAFKVLKKFDDLLLR